MRAPTLFLAALSLSPAAHAATCAGVTLPDHARDATTALTLNGMGVRRATLFRVQVYVAGLYLAAPARTAAAVLAEIPPARLVLHFTRGVTASQIRDAWHEGFATAPPALAPGIAALDAMMRDVRNGEDMVFAFTPAGVTVTIGGTPRGTVPGPAFSRALLTIWLGPSPPNPALRDGLLGGACG